MLTCFGSICGLHYKPQNLGRICLLPNDILLDIFLWVAADDEGGETLAKITSVCKYFRETAYHPEVLRRTRIVSGRPAPKKVFLYKAASKGNRRASAFIAGMPMPPHKARRVVVPVQRTHIPMSEGRILAQIRTKLAKLWGKLI